jgi:hypothetical protein
MAPIGNSKMRLKDKRINKELYDQIAPGYPGYGTNISDFPNYHMPQDTMNQLKLNTHKV